MSGYGSFTTEVAAAGLTQDGATWVKVALDPYHDYPVKLPGLPDPSVQKTVVLEVKRSLEVQASPFPSIAQPNGGDSTSNLRVDMLPLWRNTQATGSLYRFVGGQQSTVAYPTPANVGPSVITAINFLGQSADGNNSRIYPLTVIRYNNAASTVGVYPDQNGPNWNLQQIGATTATPMQIVQGLDVGDEFLYGGAIRLLAAGFECINTTPELYIGGSMTSYRAPDSFDGRVGQGVIFAPDKPGGALQATKIMFARYTTPPPNLAYALLLPGTIQGEAKEGAYVTAIHHPTKLGRWWAMDELIPQVGMSFPVPNDGGVCGCLWPGIANDFNIDVSIPLDVTPATYQAYNGSNSLETCGVIFEGLASGLGGQPAATFRINAKWVIEKVPSFNDRLIVLATPGAAYDPKAMQLYQQIAQRLPTSCKVADNPEGKWFRFITKMIGVFGQPVGAMIGGAFGAPEVGGMIGGTAAQVANSLRKRKRGE